MLPPCLHHQGRLHMPTRRAGWKRRRGGGGGARRSGPANFQTQGHAWSKPAASPNLQRMWARARRPRITTIELGTVRALLATMRTWNTIRARTCDKVQRSSYRSRRKAEEEKQRAKHRGRGEGGGEMPSKSGTALDYWYGGQLAAGLMGPLSGRTWPRGARFADGGPAIEHR
ncbi:unnamed protein product [Prorocentrum cordatum]|uniref:Uncharacterized protein n=2 Tax=Prorocentrum cordatum TaxID=2364126 RepID=A0ABN9SP21_9DINO|nr:unnamed protein product [Polarella glacialis]